MENKKQQVIREIFEEKREQYTKSEVIPFDNNKVKEVSTKVGFKNQFDATKFDTHDLLPDCLKQEGYFITHLGNGNHAFIKGIGYHYFEPIQKRKIWNLSKSIISILGSSEADIISTIYNKKIIHDFLFNDSNIDLEIHTSRRSKIPCEFWVGNHKLCASNLQVEIDSLFEGSDTIASGEVKNNNYTNFEIRQIYSSMRYLNRFYKMGDIPKKYKLSHLFIQRERKKKNKSIYCIYEYEFKDWKRMDSIKLVKNIQYDIV